MEFDSLEDLYEYVEKTHEQVACNDVQEVIKEVESDVIDEEVYSKYESPTEYERREKSGGLGDIKNMVVHPPKKIGNTIEVEITNETPIKPPNDGLIRHYRLDDVIEYGGN